MQLNSTRMANGLDSCAGVVTRCLLFQYSMVYTLHMTNSGFDSEFPLAPRNYSRNKADVTKPSILHHIDAD